MKPQISPEKYITEPSWYNPLASPYYKASHRRVRDHVRKYIEEHISPNILDWEEKGQVPDEARLHYAKAGLIYPDLPKEYRQGVPLPGDVRLRVTSFHASIWTFLFLTRTEWDVFHSLVVSYELSKIWAAGVSAGMSGGSTIGVPPVIHHGTDEQKKRWLTGLFTGQTSFCLGCTEPTGWLSEARRKFPHKEKY